MYLQSSLAKDNLMGWGCSSAQSSHSAPIDTKTQKNHCLICSFLLIQIPEKTFKIKPLFKIYLHFRRIFVSLFVLSSLSGWIYWAGVRARPSFYFSNNATFQPKSQGLFDWSCATRSQKFLLRKPTLTHTHTESTSEKIITVKKITLEYLIYHLNMHISAVWYPWQFDVTCPLLLPFLPFHYSQHRSVYSKSWRVSFSMCIIIINASCRRFFVLHMFVEYARSFMFDYFLCASETTTFKLGSKFF